MTPGVLFLEAAFALTLVGFWVHGKRTHRVVIGRRPSVISDRPRPFDFDAAARADAMAQHPAGKGGEQ